MKTLQRILHLEDNAQDAGLCRSLLEREGLRCEVVRARNAAEFHTALGSGNFDLVLADYCLPDYDGMRALAHTLQVSPEVPFIFVSGTLGEEAAIEAMKSGATDYVLKTRLSWLAPAVRRATSEAEAKADRLRAEQAVRERDNLLRAVLTSLSAHIAVLDPAGTVLAVNSAWMEYAEHNRAASLPRSAVGQNYLEACRQSAPRSPAAAQALTGIQDVLHGRRTQFVLEYSCDSSNAERWFLLYATPLTAGRGGAVLSHVDITERKTAELERDAMRQRLRQAERLASLGQLAARVADEMKTAAPAGPGTSQPPADPFADFSKLLEHYEKLLEAVKGEAAPTALVAEAEAARAQVNERVVLNLCRLLVAFDDAPRVTGTVAPGAPMETEEPAQQSRLMSALQEAIEVLEKTKRSFKSKALGELRTKLEAVIRGGIQGPPPAG